jgi:transcriptional regulator with XRE-family HTH domain
MENQKDTELLTAFANVLRRERQKAGLSQEELAHRAGKSMRYVSLLESCKHQPSLATLNRLCNGLGLKLSAFVIALEAEIDR